MSLINHFRLTEQQTASNRDGFGRALVELGKRNNKIVVLTADLKGSTRVEVFAQQFPDRFFDVGVAEQNLIGVAAGFGLSGYIAFATSYAVFSPGRTFDQIRLAVAYSQSNVKIVGSHAGLAVGEDGATHQALEDLAMMRALPGMTVIVPADSDEAYKATVAAANLKGPVYLRLCREATPVITSDQTPFAIGRATLARTGSDVTIMASGPILYEALLAAERLRGELDVRVINLHTIKPIDEAAIIEAAKETGAIVTAEDHQITGGLGSAVAEVTSAHHPVPIERIGVRDRFGESGKPAQLRHAYHLTTNDMIEAVRKVYRRKNAR